jgi:hypothetical protein
METGVRPCCRLHLLKYISQNKYNQARVAVYVTCAGHRHCLCCVLQVGRYCCRARCSRHLPAQQQTSATMINALILGSMSLQRLEETSRRPKGCSTLFTRLAVVRRVVLRWLFAELWCLVALSSAMHAQHQHQQVDACISHEHGHRDRWWQVVNDICLHSSYHVAYCILSLLTLNSTTLRNPVVVWNPYSIPGLVPANLLHHSTASAFHAQCPFASQSETAPQRFQQYAKSHRTGDLLL